MRVEVAIGALSQAEGPVDVKRAGHGSVGDDFHPLAEEAFVGFAQGLDRNAEQAVATDRAEPADTAVFLAFGEVSLKRVDGLHRNEIAALVFAEPPLRDPEI